MGLLLTTLVLAAAPVQSPETTKVLFLGNSYFRTIPEYFESFANAGGHTVLVDSYAPGGNTLGSPQGGMTQAHSVNSASLSKIASEPWDFVVLQEQSATPVIEFTKNSFMKPGAMSLDASIKANHPKTRTAMFQTWGRKDGGQFCWNTECSPLFPDFDSMQDVLTSAYVEVSRLIGAGMIPAGETWRAVMEAVPTVNLFSEDGSHPNPVGSYVGACAVYAYFFREPPRGFYLVDLSMETQLLLQDIATEVVLGKVCESVTSLQYQPSSAGPFTLEGHLGAAGTGSRGSDLVLTPTHLPEGAPGAWIVSSLNPVRIELDVLDFDPLRSLFPPRFVPAGSSIAIPIPDFPELEGWSAQFQAAAKAPGPSSVSLSRGLELTFWACWKEL